MGDEKSVVLKPQQTYIGVDTRDVHHHGWNFSTTCTPPRQRDRMYQVDRAHTISKMRRRGDILLYNTHEKDRVSYGIPYKGYISPQEILREVRAKMKRERLRSLDEKFPKMM